MTHTPKQVAIRSLVATTLLDSMGAGAAVEEESRLSYEVRNTAGQVFVNWCKAAQRKFEAAHPRTDIERKAFLMEMVGASVNFAAALLAFSAYGFLDQTETRQKLRDDLMDVVKKKLDFVEATIAKVEGDMDKLSPEDAEKFIKVFSAPPQKPSYQTET